MLRVDIIASFGNPCLAERASPKQCPIETFWVGPGDGPDRRGKCETLFQDRKHLDFPPRQQWHGLLQNQGLEMRRLTMIEERLLVLVLFVK